MMLALPIDDAHLQLHCLILWSGATTDHGELQINRNSSYSKRSFWRSTDNDNLTHDNQKIQNA